MKYKIEHFLEDIYRLEAKGMINDVMLIPSVFSKFMGFNETRFDSAIDYIRRILSECYESGQMKMYYRGMQSYLLHNI